MLETVRPSLFPSNFFLSLISSFKFLRSGFLRPGLRESNSGQIQIEFPHL